MKTFPFCKIISIETEGARNGGAAQSKASVFYLLVEKHSLDYVFLYFKAIELPQFTSIKGNWDRDSCINTR